MNTHVKSELSLLSEGFLSLLLTACLGIYLYKTYTPFPWLSFICIPIGIAIVIACWGGKRNQWTIFIIGLLFNVFVWSIMFNWSSFF